MESVAAPPKKESFSVALGLLQIIDAALKEIGRIESYYQNDVRAGCTF